MSIWTRRLFLTLSVGGGYCGVIFMSLLFPQAKGQIAGYILISAMMATFGFGVFCGLIFAEDEQRGLRLLRWFFGIQIPIISSPIFAYQLLAGAGLKLSWIGWNMSIFWRFGSEMGMWILQDRPWGLGLNVFALALFIWTGRIIGENDARRTKLMAGPAVAPPAPAVSQQP